MLEFIKKQHLNINNILITTFFIYNYICIIVGISGIASIIILINFILLCINNFDKIKKVNCGVVIFYIFVFLELLITYLFSKYGLNSMYIYNLLFYGLLFPYIFRFNFQFERILKYIVYIFVLCLPLYFSISLQEKSTNIMGISYAILPVYLAIIILMFNIKLNIIDKISIILCLPYFSFMINYASRGIIISVLTCIILCLFLKLKNKVVKIILILLFIIIIILILNNFSYILIEINDFFNSFGIKIYFFDKMLFLLEEDNITNGRMDLYSISLDYIIDKPLFGNGVGFFFNMFDSYPHNFILQALLEGGILFAVVLLYFVLMSLYLIIFNKKITIAEKSILIFLFSASIIRLSVSYEFWKEQFFWMLIIYVIYLKGRYKKNE